MTDEQVKKIKSDYDGLLIFGITLKNRKDKTSTTKTVKPAKEIINSAKNVTAVKALDEKVDLPSTFNPNLHIDIQIHISPESNAEQIDKIFESMAKHLKGFKS